jgi:hypothetical protein
VRSDIFGSYFQRRKAHPIRIEVALFYSCLSLLLGSRASANAMKSVAQSYVFLLSLFAPAILAIDSGTSYPVGCAIGVCSAVITSYAFSKN